MRNEKTTEGTQATAIGRSGLISKTTSCGRIDLAMAVQ